jgi:hypothetical protein
MALGTEAYQQVQAIVPNRTAGQSEGTQAVDFTCGMSLAVQGLDRIIAAPTGEQT